MAQHVVPIACKPSALNGISERLIVRRYKDCSCGYRVGCDIAVALRDRGFEARFVRGEHSAWYAAGGARALTAQREHDSGGVGR